MIEVPEDWKPENTNEKVIAPGGEEFRLGVSLVETSKFFGDGWYHVMGNDFEHWCWVMNGGNFSVVSVSNPRGSWWRFDPLEQMILKPNLTKEEVERAFKLQSFF